MKTIDPKSILFPETRRVLKRLEESLRSLVPFQYITFSGNGEPTLHPEFDQIVKEVKGLRDKLRPRIPIALLTNSSLIRKDRVETLKLIDLPVFKLDCGDEESFQMINRPQEGLKLEAIAKELKEISREIKITIQTVFLEGKVKNFLGEAFDNWLSLIEEIKPNFIQIYSVDRPVAEEGIRMLTDSRLLELAEKIEERTKVKTKAYLPD